MILQVHSVVNTYVLLVGFWMQNFCMKYFYILVLLLTWDQMCVMLFGFDEMLWI